MQGKIACANVLSDLYALGVTECDNMLMLLALALKLSDKERDVVVPLMIRGFRVSRQYDTSVTIISKPFLWLHRGRPWRYSVIPRTPDFQTEYQISRNSNPAGIPVFATIWGPDFRPSIIILTNMFKQIKQIRITLKTMFKVDPSPPNELRY